MTVNIGDYVLAKTAQGDLFAAGRVVAYCDAPQVCIELSGGSKLWWRQDLCAISGRRCGTCLHWNNGVCDFPIETLIRPACSSGETFPVGESDGTDCPCWEAKNV